MASPYVFVTGITGFIGFHLVLRALELGYVVRAAVRSLEKSLNVQEHPLLKPYLSSGRLSFIEIPDVLVSDAYTDALDGIDLVIHTGTPVPKPFANPERDVYQATVGSTTNLFQSALHHPRVRRVIITSSIVATMPFPLTAEHESEIFSADTRASPPAPPYTSSYQAYCAGKIRAIEVCDEFAETHPQAPFDIVSILPGYVFGRNHLIRDPGVFERTTSNQYLLQSLLPADARNEALPLILSSAVHLEDVIAVHISAIDRVRLPFNAKKPHRIVGVTSTLKIPDSEIFSVVQTAFPDAVQQNVFEAGGTLKRMNVEWDASETEEMFSLKFRSWQDMVTDVAGQYVDLIKDKAHV